MKPTSDNLGRTVMIAVIAGTLFAGFLALTPRLTAGVNTADPVTPAGADLTADQIVVSDPIVAVADVGLDGGGFDLDEDLVEDEVADLDLEDETSDDWADDESDDGESDDAECASGDETDADDSSYCDEGHESGDAFWTDVEFDGSLELSVEVLGGADGKESVMLMDEGYAHFKIHATNTTHDTLYGLFVYLEGYGHVECDSTRIPAGDTVICSAHDMVYSGEQIAEIWANAWTDEIQIGAEAYPTYYVGD